MKMKASLSSVLGVLSLMTVCCAPGPPVVLEPVGPTPQGKATANGILKIYTPTEELGNEGPVCFTGYRIYSSDGSLFKNVRTNGRISIASEEPTAVMLPEGTYLVEARAEKFPVVKVPVVIEDGRLTVVHLQWQSSRSLPRSDESHWVKLPDGQVVGWRAHLGSRRPLE